MRNRITQKSIHVGFSRREEKKSVSGREREGKKVGDTLPTRAVVTVCVFLSECDEEKTLKEEHSSFS